MAKPENIYNRIGKNQRDTAFLIFLITTLIVLFGYVLGRAYGNPAFGVGIALIFAIVEGLISFFAGDDILLAVSGAKEIQKSDNPVLFDVVQEMAIAGGLPMPRVFIIEDDSPNAFATGRDPQHAVVAATTGILEKLNREELQGVIGHEMSHVRDHDILYATIIGVMVGSIALLADFFWWAPRSRDEEGNSNAIFAVIGIVLSILAPLIAMIIQMAVSRQREYLADEEGAMLTRNPLGLASALEKISSDPQPLQAANRATQHLYIVNPLRQADEDKPSLFDTHPPTSERIRILREMAHDMGKG